MATKHMKKSSTLDFREMQNKITMRYYTFPLEWLKPKLI